MNGLAAALHVVLSRDDALESKAGEEAGGEKDAAARTAGDLDASGTALGAEETRLRRASSIEMMANELIDDDDEDVDLGAGIGAGIEANGGPGGPFDDDGN